jgi:hypothetical protein
VARGVADWGSDWAIAGFRHVTDPPTTIESSERIVSEVIGDQERRVYALIASISGSMPMMFITRVRL